MTSGQATVLDHSKRLASRNEKRNQTESSREPVSTTGRFEEKKEGCKVKESVRKKASNRR